METANQISLSLIFLVLFSVFKNISTSGSITTNTFAPKVDFTTATGSFGIAVCDIDGDGKPDIVFTNFVSNTVSVLRNTVTASTEVDDNNLNKPISYALRQNFPNPFNPTTSISFALPTRSFVSLKVFDVLGREVSTIVCGELQAGTYTRQWNAANLASGVYFYRLQAGTYSDTKKLLLLR